MFVQEFRGLVFIEQLSRFLFLSHIPQFPLFLTRKIRLLHSIRGMPPGKFSPAVFRRAGIRSFEPPATKSFEGPSYERNYHGRKTPIHNFSVHLPQWPLPVTNPGSGHCSSLIPSSSRDQPRRQHHTGQCCRFHFLETTNSTRKSFFSGSP